MSGKVRWLRSPQRTSGRGEAFGRVRARVPWIGGRPQRARQFQKLVRERGLLTKDPAQTRVGDLAFYGNPAKHTGIVTGFSKNGTPLVTSALTIGVREIKYNHLSVKFDAFAHVGLGIKPDPTPTPSATPTPRPMTT